MTNDTLLSNANAHPAAPLTDSRYGTEPAGEPSTAALAAPFVSGEMGLKPEWIDYNGHLNLAYYHVLFDAGIDGLFDAMGLGEAYRVRTGFTTYSAETHVCYLREVPPGATVRVTSQILGFDEKRLHIFQELHHVEGWCAATLESLSLSIDQRGETPKVAPFSPATLAGVAAAASAHAGLATPDRAGRSIRSLRK